MTTPDKWLPALRCIVDSLKATHPDIQALPALLTGITGNFVAGQILQRLLGWLDTVPREVIYKSDKDLMAETGLSDRQLRNARRAIKDSGVCKVEIKKANGAPTNHYSINVDVLYARIAQVYGVDVSQIPTPIAPEKRPNGFDPTEQIQLPTVNETIPPMETNGFDPIERMDSTPLVESITNIQQSLPQSTTTNQTSNIKSPADDDEKRDELQGENAENSETVKALLEFGVKRPRALTFQHIPLQIAQEKIKEAKRKYAAKIVIHPQGFLISELEGWRPSESPESNGPETEIISIAELQAIATQPDSLFAEAARALLERQVLGATGG